MVRRRGAIDGAEAEAGRDLAGDDAVERVGTGEIAERKILEQQRRTIIEGLRRGVVEQIANPDALEGMVQRMAHRELDSGAGLRIVQNILQLIRRQVQSLPGLQLVVFSLIEVVAAAENPDSRLDCAVEQVGLGEAQTDVALLVPDRRLHIQSFAQTKQIVGGIVQPDERAGQSADAAG